MAIRGLLGNVDKDVLISVDGVDGLHPVQLRVVEEYGVWVESERLLQTLLFPLGCEPGQQRMVFLPYAHIRFILSGNLPARGAGKGFAARMSAAPANGR